MHAARYKDDQALWVHLDDLSRLTGITAQRLRQMSHEGHFPQTTQGYLDLYETVPAIIKYLRAGGQLERHRMAKAKADIAEMKAKQMRGEFLEVQFVEQQMVQMATRFKQKLFNIPNRASPLLATESDPVAVGEILTKLIEEAARELVNAEPYAAYPESQDEFTDGNYLARNPVAGDDEAEYLFAEEEDDEAEEPGEGEGLSSESLESSEGDAEGDDASAQADGQYMGGQVSQTQQ